MFTINQDVKGTRSLKPRWAKRPSKDCQLLKAYATVSKIMWDQYPDLQMVQMIANEPQTNGPAEEDSARLLAQQALEDLARYEQICRMASTVVQGANASRNAEAQQRVFLRAIYLVEDALDAGLHARETALREEEVRKELAR